MVSRKEREEEDTSILDVIKQFGYKQAIIFGEDIQYNFELFFNHPFNLPQFTYKWSLLAALIRRNMNCMHLNQFEQITIDSNRVKMLVIMFEKRTMDYVLLKQKEE